MPQKRNRRSGVEDRWTQGNGQPSAVHGKGLRWRARYVDEECREHARGFDRKSDAQQWIDHEVTAKFASGTYVDPKRGKVTFASFYAGWAPRQVWVSGTRHAMDLAAKSVTFGNIGLADLRPSHVEAWIKALQDSGLARTTIRTRYNNVRNVIRAAVRDRFMGRDVTDQVKLPRARKASVAMSIPTAEELGTALDAADGWFEAYVAVCAFAGLRRAEASALKVSDVDFLRKETQVARQVQWTDDGQMEIRGPKYGSERTVYVPDGLLEILAEHIRVYRPGDDPDRWLFPGAWDATHPAHAATVARTWRTLRTKVGISYPLHSLRHFYASGLIRAGCDVVTVQRALGHSSASVTLNTYSHLWPDASDRTRKAAGALLGQVLESTADALRTEAPKTPSD